MNRDVNARIPGSAHEWMSYAKSDLRLAHLAAADELVLRAQACFHAQQAAEKAIKAVLLSRSIEFPFTHDIEELLEIAESAGVALPGTISEGGSLTPYAVETRYPGYWHEITEHEMQDALRFAELTVKWADEAVEESGSGS